MSILKMIKGGAGDVGEASGEDFIAVEESQAESAGAIVYFRTSGMHKSALESAIAGTGLDASLLPALPSNEVALRRALDEQKAKRRLIRPLEGGGWAVVDEHVDNEGNPSAYELAATVRLSKNPPEELVFTIAGAILENEILAEFHRQKASYAAADISQWLIELAAEHNAVSPRDRGGVYFVPKGSLDSFRAWAKVLETASAGEAKVYFIPSMKSSDAVEAILDAITREAESEAEAMEEALSAHADALSAQPGDVGDATSSAPAAGGGAGGAEAAKPMGKRAIGTKLKKLGGIGKKLSVYEELLGTRLDVVRERLERVRADLTVAAVALESEKGSD